MLVGDLAVKMSADMADLRTGMQQMRTDVKGAVDDVGKYLDGLKNTLLGFASLAAFQKLISDTIQYGTELKRMQDITGLAAAEVQKLSAIAQLNDVDAQTVTRSWGKFVERMGDVSKEGDKARAIVAAMGVEALDPLTGKLLPANELMARMAVGLNAIQDPALKAQVATALYAKAWQDMIVIAKNYVDDSAKVDAALGGTRKATDDATTAADELGDAFTLVGLAIKSETMPHLSPLTDAMGRVLKAFFDTSDQTSLFGKALDFVITKIVVPAIETIGALALAASGLLNFLGTMIGGIAAATAAITSGQGLAAAGGILKDSWNDATGAIRSSNESIAKLMDHSQKAAPEVKNLSTETDKQKDAALRAAVATGDHTTKISDAEKAAKKAAEEIQKLADKYNAAFIADQQGIATQTLQQVSDLTVLLVAGKIPFEQWNAQITLAYQNDPKLKAAQDEVNKSLKEAFDAIQKVATAWGDEEVKLNDQVAAQKKANEEFGKSKTEIANMTIAEYDRQIAFATGVEGTNEYVAHLERMRAKAVELRDAIAFGEAQETAKKNLDAIAKEAESTLGKIDDFARATFTGLFNDTGDLWEKTWNTMKSVALNIIYELAIHPIVINLVANFAGALGMDALASAASKALGGSLTSGAGNIFTSIFGTLFDTTTLFHNLGLASLSESFGVAGDMLSVFGSTLAETLNPITAVTDAFSLASVTLPNLIPVIGTVVAAGALLFSFLNKGGGPKEGGWAATGPTPGITGTDSSGRWMTPSQRDADILNSLNQLNDQFKTVATALGGMPGAISFALGYATDPKGTAPTNVHAGVFTATGQIYNAESPNVGRSAEELNAELQLQSQRMLLAALQSTELPTAVHNALMAVDVTSASIDQITQAMNNAAKAAAFIQALTEAVKAIPEELASGLLEAVGVTPDIDLIIADFVSAADDFATASKKFNDASKAFWEAAGKVQDALDRDPKAEALNNYALAHASIYDKVGIAKEALLDLVGKYDGSTDATNKLADATNAYRDAQVEAIVQVYAMRDALLGPDGLFAQTAKTLDWALMSKQQQTDFLISEAQKTIELLSTTTDPEQINKFDQLINSDLVKAFNLMSPEEQSAQHDKIQGILDHAAAITAQQLTAAESIINDSTIAAGTTLGAVQVVLDEAGQKWNDAAQVMADTAEILKDAAQQIVDAAADVKAGGDGSSVAAVDFQTAVDHFAEVIAQPIVITPSAPVVEEKGP